MTQASHQLVRDFFTAMEAGELPDGLLSDDFSGWTTTQGALPGEKYAQAIPLMAKMTGGTGRFTIDSITAEDDRAVAEVRSHATLVDGSDYQNTYVFVFRIADGQIRSVAEHFNIAPVQEQLIPLLTKMMAQD